LTIKTLYSKKQKIPYKLITNFLQIQTCKVFKTLQVYPTPTHSVFYYSSLSWGIESQNTKTCKELGFDGVAIMGAIWKEIFYTKN
jgi:hypothetical protein